MIPWLFSIIMDEYIRTAYDNVRGWLFCEMNVHGFLYVGNVRHFKYTLNPL